MAAKGLARTVTDSEVFVVVRTPGKPLEIVAGRDYELARMVEEFRTAIARMQSKARLPEIPEDDPE